MSTVESVQTRMQALREKVDEAEYVERRLVDWQIREVVWAFEFADKAVKDAAKRRKETRRDADLRGAEWYCDRIELALAGIDYMTQYTAAQAFLRDKRVAREQASRGEQVA